MAEWSLRGNRPRLIELSVLALLFVVSVVIRTGGLSNLVAGPDEFTYASRAFWILGGNWAWPQRAMWDQPPLFEYMLAFATVVAGASLDSLREVSIIMGSLGVVAGYYLGKSLYGRIAGLVAASTIAVNPFDILYSKQLYIEATVTTLILFALLLFWEGVIKNKSLKVAVLGGVAFGLALDAKYITLVMTVALIVGLVLYRKKIPGGFPRREVLVYFCVGFLMFVPVILDLAVNNVNPFYFDLIGRFQMQPHTSGVKAAAGASGDIVYIGFRNFIQTFFRYSPTNIFTAYAGSILAIPVWIAASLFVFAFFVGSFFLRRNPREGILLILFIAFLGFAFSYPGKRTYFTMYPMLIFIVMLGGLVQLSAERISLDRKLNLRTFLAACIICLTVAGVITNAFGVPATQKSGFGDWDNVTPIVSYINTNHGPNSYVAINLALVGYYILRDNVNVSLLWMDQEQAYYSEPVQNQSLQSIIEGQYPIYKVISLSTIELVKPQFVVIPNVYYSVTSLAFKSYMTEYYFEPLTTQQVLLFQLRADNGTG